MSKMTPEQELDHLRYMLRHLLHCGSAVNDGELIGMVRHMRDEKDRAQAVVRALENRLLRYGIPLSGPLPSAEDE